MASVDTLRKQEEYIHFMNPGKDFSAAKIRERIRFFALLRPAGRRRNQTTQETAARVCLQEAGIRAVHQGMTTVLDNA